MGGTVGGGQGVGAGKPTPVGQLQGRGELVGTAGGQGEWWWGGAKH